jgi:hypothetical protein
MDPIRLNVLVMRSEEKSARIDAGGAVRGRPASARHVQQSGVPATLLTLVERTRVSFPANDVDGLCRSEGVPEGLYW